MSFLSKIVSSLIFSIIFLFIALAILFGGESSKVFLEDDFLVDKTYPFEHTSDGGEIVYSFSIQEDVLMAPGTDKISNISGNDTPVYSLDGKYSFFTSFKKPGQEYVFSGNGFEIRQQGIGEVFMDTATLANANFVYSISSPVEVVLMEPDSEKIYTSIYLLPGMYLEFQPARAKLLANADRLRVETIYKLGYYSPYLESQEEDGVVSKYLSDEFKQFFLSYNQRQKEQAQMDLNRIKSIDDFSIQLISNLEFVDFLFLNDEKKTYYHKSVLFSSILDLLKGEDVDTSSFRSHMKSLQAVSVEDYLEIQRLVLRLQGIQYYLGSLHESQYILFSHILGDSFEDEELVKLSLFLHKNFFLSTNIAGFLEGFSAYFEQNIVQSYDEYYMFYFEKILIDELQKQEPNISLLIQALAYTQELGERVYDKNDKFTQTGLLKYDEILSLIDVFISENLFAAERDENQLLLRLESRSFLKSEIMLFEKNILGILEYLKVNQGVLNIRDVKQKHVIDNISTYNSKFLEYILALKNPEEYRKQYSASTQNVFTILGGGEDGRGNVSASDLREFFLSFDGLINSDFEINEKLNDLGSVFTISNYNVGGYLLNFSCIPSQDMLLTDIRIDGESKNFQYKLGDIYSQYILQKDEVSGFESSDFFIRTFFTQNKNTTEYFQYNIQESSEDKLDIIFKREILLGETGEFSDISDIFTFEYDDIYVEKNQELYDVYVNNIPFTYVYTSPSGNNTEGEKLTSTQGRMSGRYNLVPNEASYFSDIQINFNIRDKENTQIAFDDSWIFLEGNILKGDFPKIFTSLAGYVEAYEQVSGAFLSTGVTIEKILFEPSSGKMSIKFVKDRKNYTMVFNQAFVLSIMDDQETILHRGVRFSELSEKL